MGWFFRKGPNFHLLCAPIVSILCLTIFAPSLAVTLSSLNQCFVASLNSAAQVTH